jgi:hypothetical protein
MPPAVVGITLPLVLVPIAESEGRKLRLTIMSLALSWAAIADLEASQFPTLIVG